MHFIGSLLKDHGKTRPDSHAFSNHVCMLRPESRGYIALKSLDPTVESKLREILNDTRTLDNISFRKKCPKLGEEFFLLWKPLLSCFILIISL